MDLYREANRQLWDEPAAIHPSTDFDRLEEFRAGWDPLRPFELEEMGDVSGRTLLHLQCHFGMATLAWARHGARVTGVDFSERAIATARSLAAELGIEASFVHSELYRLPERLVGEFDVVYTSLGAIYSLPDIDGWAAVIARHLKPGGTFYIAELHPITHVFDDAEGVREPLVRHPYFHHPVPRGWPVRGSYAAPEEEVEAKVEYGWNHSLGDVVSAIAGHGLRIDFLHELPFSRFRWAPFLQRRDDGNWWLADHIRGELPMIFTLRATKPERTG